MRRATSRPGLGVLALVLLLAGCGQAGPTSSAAPTPKPAHSPPLRTIQDERNRILDGGSAAFKARLAALRGHAVVVNQWASWCPPCRQEFPYFQRVAAKWGDRVGFLGVDAADSRDDAQKFLRKFPTPYPHYFDPDNKIARLFHGGVAWPTTAFYTPAGELSYSHPGAYRSEAALEQDLRRYSLGG